MAASVTNSLQKISIAKSGFSMLPNDRILSCAGQKCFLCIGDSGSVEICQCSGGSRTEIERKVGSAITSPQCDVIWCISGNEQGIVSCHMTKTSERAEIRQAELCTLVKNVLNLEITLPLEFLPNTNSPWLLSSSYQLLLLGLMESENVTSQSVPMTSLAITPQQAFSLPYQAQTVNMVKACHDVLCVHNQQHFIDCFSLTSRLLLRHVDLRQTALDSPLTNFAFSPNCGTLSLVSDHRLVILAFPEKRAESHRRSSTTRLKTRTSPSIFSTSSGAFLSLPSDRSSSRTSLKPHRVSSASSISSLDSDLLVFELGEKIEDDFDVDEVACGTLKTSVLCTAYDEKATETLVVVDHQTSSISCLRCEENERLVFSPDSSQPHLLVSGDEVYVVCGRDEDERDIVDKWRHEEFAEFADTPRTSSVQSLDVGLRHKQLDTVAFYLSNRESVFLPRGADCRTVPWTQKDITSLDTYLQLLKSSIDDNLQESSTFANEILRITLRHLHHLLRQVIRTRDQIGGTDNVINDVTMSADVDWLVDKLEDWIMTMRRYLEQPDVEEEAVARQVPNDDVTVRWAKFSKQDIMEDCIVQNRVPLGQHYLRQRDGTNVTLRDVTSTAVTMVIVLLRQRQMADARLILGNQGFDIHRKLKDICVLTMEKSLRHYLISALNDEQVWTEAELANIRHLDMIESVYSCQSVMTSQDILRDAGKILLEDSLSLTSGSSPGVTSTTSSPGLVPGDADEVEERNCESPNYSHLNLALVSDWDSRTVQNILLERSYGTRDSSLKSRLEPFVVWTFLTRRCFTQALLLWIRCQWPLPGEPHYKVGPQGAPPWPCGLQINQKMVDAVADCPEHVRDVLYDQMARRGVFCTGELDDFPKLLHRLSRITASLAPHHKAPQTGPPGAHGAPGGPAPGVVGPNEYQVQLVRYLVEKRLVPVLYHYIHIFGLADDSVVSRELELLSADHPWLDLMLCLIRLDTHESADEAELMLRAVLSNERFLTNQSQADVVAMVTEGHVTAALATLVYSHYSWRELISGVETEHGHVDKSLLIKMASDYPKLASMIQQNSPTTYNRVNVYQLLEGDSPLDVGRLFGWQSENSIASSDEDTWKELPHFSLPHLQSELGSREELHPSYYLRQGRPTFAYHSFLASQDGAPGKGVGDKQLSVAVLKAQILAVRSFLLPSIVAACVTYIHMLGGDSTLLRVYVHAATTLYIQRTRAVSGTPSVRKEINKSEERAVVELLLSCLSQRRLAAESVLTELVAAASVQIERETAKCCSMDCALRWTPVLLFCRLHSLPLDTTYLTWCARQDDWLQFVTFAQMHQYPPQQLLSVLHQFPSKHLREHLSYVIANVSTRSDDVSKRSDDVKRLTSLARQTVAVRQQLIRKVLAPNVQKKKEESEEEEEDEDEDEEVEERTEAATDGSCPYSSSGGEDLFSVLFTCLNEPCPWKALLHQAVILKNMVLAVLAACCQGWSWLDCICCYLKCYLTSSSRDDDGVDRCCHDYTLKDLYVLTEKSFKSGHFVILAKAYSIFTPECSLVPALNFCVEARNRDWHGAKKYLNEFKTLIEQMKSSPSHASHYDVTPPGEWACQTVAMVMRRLLGTLESAEDVYQTTNMLSQAGVNSALRGRGLPDFDKLSRLVHIARERSVPVDCRQLISADTYTPHCQTVLDRLIRAGYHDDARHFAKRAGIDTVQVTIQQVMSRLSVLKESSIWRAEHGRILFWQDCDQIFTKHRIPPEIAAKFYQEHMNGAGCAEKVFLCRTACRWLALTDQTAARHQARTALWRAQIQLEIRAQDQTLLDSDLVQSSLSSEESTGYSKQDLMVYGQVPRQSRHADLSPEETVGVRSLLGKLLCRGHVMEACSLAAEFGHYSSELAIIMTCIGLALGELDVSGLDPELRALVESHVTIPRRRSRGSSFNMPGSPGANALNLSGSSLGSDTSQEPQFSRQVQSTFAAMTSLLDQCQQGYQCCARVITTYAIAQVLCRSYSSVLMKEESEVLESLLASEYWNKYELAKDFITTSSMADSEVSGFLATYVTKLLSQKKPESSPGAVAEEYLDDQTWQQLMRLCADSSLLGQQLLEATTSRMEDEDDKTALPLEVDLLIRSHDCFTVSCHMEGINSVLRTSRKLTARLVGVHEFTLIIRLLVGIARYSEMTYIFDLLKHHQEFLLLFRKGVEKDSRLKMAVLDYLKRFHPSDVETYNMVALHYSMYREIAQLLETEAGKMLRDISSKTLEDSTETLQKLSTTEQYLCDAAESYVKDDCYRHANNVMKRARLVALQQQLLSSNVHILNLGTESVTKFIISHPKFSEAYIVAEAYNRRSEWAGALCERVIVLEDWKYLQEFQTLIPVTENLVEEVVQRYRLLRLVTAASQVNMKRFLRLCDNVETRYRLAASLGFSDVTQELLRGEAANYLRDVLNIS